MSCAVGVDIKVICGAFGFVAKIIKNVFYYSNCRATALKTKIDLLGWSDQLGAFQMLRMLQHEMIIKKQSVLLIK